MSHRRAHPPARHPAAQRLRSSRRSSAGGSASRPTGSRCSRSSRSGSSRWPSSFAGADRRRAVLEGRSRTATAFHWFDWIPAGDVHRRGRLLRRPADGLPADRGHDHRPAGPHLLDRLHEPRPGLLAVLRLPQPVHVQHARCWSSRTRGCWCSWPGSWSACRATCSSASGIRKRSAALAAKKAFIVNRVGDVGFALGIMAIFVNTGTPQHPRVDRGAARARRDRQPDPADDRRPAGLRRGDGQERPVPAARLAARRDGGPDPGLRPHPRGHDGQRRRVPGRPRQPALRGLRRRRWWSSPGSASSRRSSPRRSR